MNKLDINSILALDSNDSTIKLKNLPRNVVLYGAGAIGKHLIRICINNGIRPIVCDSDKAKIGTIVMGIKVMSFDEVLLLYSDFKVIICSHKYYEQIRSHMLKYVSAESIYNLEESFIFDGVVYEPDVYTDFLKNNCRKLDTIYQALEDNESREVMENVIKGHYTANGNYFKNIHTGVQYFPDDIISLSYNEVFIDGGAYTGDTLKEFIKRVNNKYEKIYSFEPTETIFYKLIDFKKKQCNDDIRINLFQKGLFSHNKVIGFLQEDASFSNRIDESSDAIQKVEVVAIDEFIDDNVTFIKMDVEGAELAALQGAKNIISKYKPKLAISIYHKYEDMITIPEFIMGLGLNYKYYIRHHGFNSCETIFYAV